MRQLRADEDLVGNATADDAFDGILEPPAVVVFAFVESERLLIEVAKQIERFNRDVGALDGAFQETPEVLAPVGMDFAVHVGFGVVDHVVGVVRAEG